MIGTYNVVKQEVWAGDLPFLASSGYYGLNKNFSLIEWFRLPILGIFSEPAVLQTKGGRLNGNMKVLTQS